MSNAKLSFLGILAAASIVAAVFVSKVSNRTRPAAIGTGYLVQGLNPENVAEILIGKGKEPIDLKKVNGEFVVVNKDSYPAENKGINNLIATLLDMQTIQLYTANKANFKDLGVTEDDATNIVKFLDDNGKTITGVVVGKMRDDGMSYARLVNSDEVYTVDKTPWVKSSAIEYTNQELLTINKADIASVTVSSPNDTYTIVSDANGTEVTLKYVPFGKKQKSGDCRQVLEAVDNLKFDDVASAEKKSGLKFDRKYECLLKDSSLYTFEIAKSGSKTYIKCSADFTDKTPIKKEQEVESQGELKKKETKLIARDKVKKFQETCGGWVYQIAEYKAGNLTKPLKELVEDITPSKPADANTPAEQKPNT